MGRIRNYLVKALEKAEDYLASKDNQALEQSDIDAPIDTIDSSVYEMQPGVKLTSDEKIEENKYLISTLDSKTLFLLKMIDQLHPEEDAIHTVASDPAMMRAWLGHISYKNKIEEFTVLITGQDKRLLDPTVLAGKNNKPAPKPKRIKCLQDLPLQKTLLN
jgi:hypothetical protein